MTILTDHTTCIGCRPFVCVFCLGFQFEYKKASKNEKWCEHEISTSFQRIVAKNCGQKYRYRAFSVYFDCWQCL